MSDSSVAWRFTTRKTDDPTTQPLKFVVIGQLVASLIYIQKIFQTYPNALVYHLVEGPNHYDNPSIRDPGFGNVGIVSSNYSCCNQINYVTGVTADLLFEIDSSVNFGDNVSKRLLTPFGLGAEAIACYPSVAQQSPFIGTTNDFGQNLQALGVTSNLPLEGKELINAQTLATAFDISPSNKLITESPSIYTRHFRYISSQSPDGDRVTGADVYFTLLSNYPAIYSTGGPFGSGVPVSGYVPVFNVTGVLFSNIVQSVNTAGRPFITADVQYSSFDGSFLTISSALIALKGTIFDNVRVATLGGLPTLAGVSNAYVLPPGQVFPNPGLTTLIPSFYRSVYAVPLNSTIPGDIGPVNSNNRQQLSFALPDPTILSCANLGWLVQCYTTLDDLRTGQHADTGKTLLIVEAISLYNSRAMYWDSGRMAFTVVLNTDAMEVTTYNTYVDIVTQVRAAYGDTTVVPDLEDQCATSGVCRTLDHISQGQNFLFNDFLLLSDCLCIWRRVLNGNRN